MEDLQNESDEEWLIALVRLKILNAPGSVPSSIKIEPGQRFQLDGDEAVDAEQLLNNGAIAVYTGSPEQEALRTRTAITMKKKLENPLRRKLNERSRGK
jgi:hypothetical protein